jgi:hypothetical protein
MRLVCHEMENAFGKRTSDTLEKLIFFGILFIQEKVHEFIKTAIKDYLCNN